MNDPVSKEHDPHHGDEYAALSQQMHGDDLAKLRAETLALIHGTTPGPWDGVGLTVYDTCLDGVASCHTGADARLIAAAPTLAADNLRLVDEIERLTAENERMCAELRDGQLRRSIASFYGNHSWLLRTMIDAAGALPKLEPGPFCDGFEAGVEEVLARADASAGDDGHQLQDIWAHITLLVTGRAVLLCLDDGESAEDIFPAIALARAALKETRHD